jgi:N-acetylmuramoyl-L-alanine amidase CwlA
MTTYSIRQDFLKGVPHNPYRKGKPEGVIAHSTATPEATAKREHDYEQENWNKGFVHFFVDWNEIVQVADTKYSCWGCGAIGNPRFVQVEFCETRDTAKFKASYDRYVWLLAKLLHDNGFGIDKLHTHHWVTQNLGGTTHTDPDGYLASHGVSIAQFYKDVQRKLDDYSRVYVMKNGDTLWGVSKKLGVSVETLISKNGIKDPTKLQIGQKLKY